MTALGGRLPCWFLLLLIAIVGLSLIGLPEFVNTHGYDVLLAKSVRHSLS
jgi:hypothetical protein